MTAGFTWPPEMLAPTETATKRAKPWQMAMATSPAGSRAALDVNLSVTNEGKTSELKPHKQESYSLVSSMIMTSFSNFIHNYVL